MCFGVGSVIIMPDPQQQQHAVASRGLELFRTVGRRLVRTEKNSRHGNDSSLDSGTDSKNLQNSGRQNDTTEKILTDQALSEGKTKRVRLQTDSTDSCSEGTASTSGSNTSSSISSALSKVFANLKIGEKRKKSKQRKPQQKSILRRPVPHMYVRGVNGLPQRVPLNRDYYRQNASVSHHPGLRM